MPNTIHINAIYSQQTPPSFWAEQWQCLRPQTIASDGVARRIVSYKWIVMASQPAVGVCFSALSLHAVVRSQTIGEIGICAAFSAFARQFVVLAGKTDFIRVLAICPKRAIVFK